MAQLLGRVLGERYELLSILGQGAMGTVYMASYGRLKRRVAVKVLPAHLLGDDEARVRFNNEIWAATQLDHPNIVRALDAGVEPDGTPWLVMEYLKGRNLREVIRTQGAMSWPRTIPIVEDVLRGLEAAHGRNLVHRDLKPENLFLLNDGRPGSCKILDFGIVKAVGEHSGGVTRVGSFLGTPAYAAPELIRGEPCPATDLYALAATWFELLCGVPPYGRGDAIKTLWKHLDEMPNRPNHVRPELGLPFGVEELLMQMLEKHPADRPASAWATLERLAEQAPHHSTHRILQDEEPTDLSPLAGLLPANAVFPPLFGPTGTALVRPRWEELDRSPSDSGEIPIS